MCQTTQWRRRSEAKKMAHETPKKNEVKAYVPSCRSKTKIVDGKGAKAAIMLPESGMTVHLTEKAV